MINRIWAYAIVNPATVRAAFVRSVTSLGLTDVALFVNGLDEPQFAISPARERVLGDTIMDLHREGVSPHLVSWLRPTERWMNDAAARLRRGTQRAVVCAARRRGRPVAWQERQGARQALRRSGQTAQASVHRALLARHGQLPC